MTDPTPTMNEQIALELGWIRLGSGVWRNPNGSIWNGLPDFEHDCNYNGPLQDDLWGAGFDLSHDNVDGTFYWYKLNEYGTPLDDDREDTTDLKKATALDWLAWKKEHPND